MLKLRARHRLDLSTAQGFFVAALIRLGVEDTIGAKVQIENGMKYIDVILQEQKEEKKKWRFF